MQGKALLGGATYLHVIQPERTLLVLARDRHSLGPLSAIVRGGDQ